MAQSERSIARSEATPFGWLENWNPFSDFFESSLRNRMLDEFFGERRRMGIPAMPLDVTEADGKYVLTAEVPGVDKKDITIECKDGVLSIRGEKKSQREETREKARILERSYGAFSRTLALPDDADVDHVEASFRDGVLRIEIQKKPGAKVKAIAIKS